MDTSMMGIVVAFSFGLLYFLSLRAARKRVDERLDLAQLRLQLRDIRVVGDVMTATLTGWRGTTRVQLVGHFWGATDVHASIEAKLPPRLRLCPQGRRSSAHGTQDLQIGLPVLDDRLQVQSAHPSAAISYLRDERTRRALRGLMEGAPDAEVNEGEVRLTVSVFEDLGQFERKAEAVIQAARRLAEATLPEGTLLPEEPPPTVGPVAPSQVPMPQVSSEYLVRMRFEYSQMRLRLRYVYGTLLATCVFVGLGYEGLLQWLIPFERHARAWEVMGLMAGLVGSALILLIHRCPACLALLRWRSRLADGHTSRLGGKKVECPKCGLRLR